LAALFVVIAFGGFIPTYYAPLAAGTFQGPRLLHLHALLISAWVLLYLGQTLLVAQRRMLDHRAWGMAGIALLSAICCTVVISAITSIKLAEAKGVGDAARAFSIVSLTGVVLISGLVWAAIANVARPDVHKRLMTLSFVPLLEAPMARPFAVLLAPPEAIGLPPPVFVTVLPSLVIDLIIVALVTYDLRTRGKVHPATLWGGLSIVLVQVGCIPLSGTPAWMAIARAIESLAG